MVHRTAGDPKGGLSQWNRPDTQGSNTKLHAFWDITGTAGWRMGLIGPNGANERKLVKLMIGELKPDHGDEFRHYVP